MDAEAAASLLVEGVGTRPWGVAAAAIVGDDARIRLREGDDRLDEGSVFELGSVTKTMIGVLLADAILQGETSGDATLGTVLGVSGGAADVTLGDLATHRGGLPRLPPNLDLAKADRLNPYAGYAEEDLRAALNSVVLGKQEYLYSNFGFMVLGMALAEITAMSIPRLLGSRLFGPLAMGTAGCPPPDFGRVPGYSGADRTPWWDTALPGAGGVGVSIVDLCAYLRAHLDLPLGPLGDAIRLATPSDEASPAGYGWSGHRGGWWHNGRTGGFRSFVAFHRPTRTAVALLANSTQMDELDSVCFATLTRLVRSHSAV